MDEKSRTAAKLLFSSQDGIFLASFRFSFFFPLPKKFNLAAELFEQVFPERLIVQSGISSDVRWPPECARRFELGVRVARGNPEETLITRGNV